MSLLFGNTIVKVLVGITEMLRAPPLSASGKYGIVVIILLGVQPPLRGTAAVRVNGVILDQSSLRFVVFVGLFAIRQDVNFVVVDSSSIQRSPYHHGNLQRCPATPELGGTTTTNASHQQQHHAAVAGTSPGSAIDIEAWTVSALQSLAISPDARGTGAPLSIPLDGTTSKPSVTFQDARATGEGIRRPPSRRDSMKRREVHLKGKEGSRQRRRWENDRLMHVPNVQPPQPFDWEPRPTHPVHHVPYQIAAAWDLRLRVDVEAKKAAAALRKQQHTKTLGDDAVAGRVPRELFLRAKKTPAVKTWVRSLEEPVRKFLVDQHRACEEAEVEDSNDGSTEDEEIVFVGRNGTMRDGWKKARREDKKQGATEEGMVFDALGDDDESSAFKRWLTHSISDYYGLESRSVLVGNPSRKVVYVAPRVMKAGHAPSPALASLPRPLWQLCS
ncbi:hypothetical protein PG994_012966 [Apiospora phragmitis]|uniref:R3H-associated N-terminal domain-containing protein n=1 Tax=Apiospora phragmitis TaxID=2905665 RepID=A0ABR1T9T9_9PEZI